ncbi:N-acetyltransferase 9 [Rhinatrema bivittatum]|uniref:N-acetyltransferase 9 n=1 Tax=Rhinatrema bivittatum TaxID=194408 RepID=UPI0011264439|nr:N-acetyltransferase 9 [Rhinatrema bivittatum]XP_029456461.1 N-acetyltransferase 9 [Rhinatrema bivittatum]XP_029456462.1 N-acetyltransferase 9 [Rhinatrema bivittatum]
MRINQDTVLQGKLVALVPYTSQHVPRYHEWMKSETLQKLTASEPLTLEQEYSMQRSWREDEDKCTFIVIDQKRWVEQACMDKDCMVGDVNLFLTDPEDPTLGEIEVMIAEPNYRGKGFGKEAALMMMFYGLTKLGIASFEAKIGQENKASICMFQKLHFEEVSVSSVFQEVTMKLVMDEQQKEWLLALADHVTEAKYSETRQHSQQSLI